MHDPKLLRENPEKIKAGIARKHDKSDIDEVLALDADRREIVRQGEALKAERNKVSGEIAKARKVGESVDEAVAAMKEVGEQISRLDQKFREVEERLYNKLIWIPNIPDDSVPDGKDENDAVVVREWGQIPKFDFKPKPHWEIGEALGILDIVSAVKVSGSGFFALKGYGASLQRALISYMLNIHIAAGFIEHHVPHLVSVDAMTGTGQLPKMDDDMYKTVGDNMYLIPTGEVPLTNMYREQILNYDQLPIMMVGHTPCFRREAGAAGKDTRGMLRVHQFDKVELVKIVRPETSWDELENLTAQVEKVLQGLEIPYRVMNLAAGDLSFASAKTYDLEIWSAGLERWLEVSSVTNFEAFQARRMKCRFRDEQKKVIHPHTLNGSGTALPRLMAAIIENYQNADGSVTVPEVIRPYLGGVDRIG